MSDNVNHGGRIARLETSMATLAETTANMQKSLDGLTGKVDHGFSDMAKFQQNAGRLNIGQLASVIGVTIVLVGAFGSPYISTLADVRDDVKELIQDNQDISETRWRRSDAERAIDSTNKDFDDMRNYIDRRDERVLSISNAKSQDLSDDIRDIRVWLSEYDRLTSAINARQDSKLESRQGQEDRILELEKELARRSSIIDSIEKEQARRRPIIYDQNKE